MSLKKCSVAGVLALGQLGVSATVVIAQMAVSTGAQLGSQGEAFDDVALVQECIFETEEPFCVLMSRGFTYYASADTKTQRYVLEAIGSLNVNDAVKLEGDIVSMGDMSAEVAIYAARHDPTLDVFAETRAMLQGPWVAAADTRYQSYVMGVVVEDSIDGEVQSEYIMQLANTCDAAQGQGPVMIAHENPWDEPMCFVLDKVTQEQLRLRLAGGDGQQVIYLRP